MNITCLDNRSVVRVTGVDAGTFLQNLLTCDVDSVAPGKAVFGALLTPQGKILFDFFLHRTADGVFLFDIDAAQAEAFAKRLGFYRLRAKVEIGSVAELRIVAGWNGAPLPAKAVAASPDPRLESLGWRAVVAAEGVAPDCPQESYTAHRIALGVPEGGADYALGDTFPHDADMDQLHGVSFTKGCYVGQEVVSRMQHRSTARTRCVEATFTGEAPPPGSSVTAGEKTIGTTGSAAGGKLVAMVRIDKASDAVAAGEAVTAAGVRLSLRKPDWASFDFPANKE